MKAKIFFFCLLTGLLLNFGCDDSIDFIGMGVQPKGDRITARRDTILLTGKTVKADSIFAKTVNGLLGRFNDKVYYDITAGYLCQFVPPPASIFTKNDLDSLSFESIVLGIDYTTFTGDSLTPMEVTVYPLSKTPESYPYAYTDPAKALSFLSEYYNPKEIWGRKAYTAHDSNLPDTLSKSLAVSLPTSLGKRLYKEYTENNCSISEAFLAEHLPGIYVASTFGSGCVLNIEHTAIYVQCKRLFGKTVNGEDSVGYKSITFDVTKEVIQINSYTGNDQKLTEENADKMYIKTPTGIFSELTIPIEKIRTKVSQQKFSSVKLTLYADPQSEGNFPLDIPGTGKATPMQDALSKLLLINAEDNDTIINAFFENKQSVDNVTSYLTTFDSGTNTYTFANIANMIQQAMADMAADPTKTELKVRLIPIQIMSSTQSSYYGSSTTEYAPANYLYPSAVTLSKKDLQIEILSADLDH
ncbi:MAG: DUF4270 domain-containing protein [Candidatus Symbiothrix sp.]|jgi:hypothetical protein|nr:DUF4270 domain-containing protein [Candidatus Symbiothrix sp.]